MLIISLAIYNLHVRLIHFKVIWSDYLVWKFYSNFLEKPSRSWHLKWSYFRNALICGWMISFLRHAWNSLSFRSLANLHLSMITVLALERKLELRIVMMSHIKIKRYFSVWWWAVVKYLQLSFIKSEELYCSYIFSASSREWQAHSTS